MMIEIDHENPLPVSEQLVQQLRYHIAAGRYPPGERLPSTRALGTRLGVSFHTVRKAYQRLGDEGLLTARRGGGFIVRERRALSKAERMERGAAVVQDALQKLVALGLSEEETDFVLEEQRTYAESPAGRRKILFAAGYAELAEAGAEQLTGLLGETVEPVTFDALGRHADTEVVVAPLADVRETVAALPGAETLGVRVDWPHDLLARVARLGSGDSVALVVRQSDAIEPITAMIRASAGFPGSVYSLTADAERPRLEAMIRRSDVVLYTPQVRRRVRPVLGEKPSGELAPTLSPDSLSRVREAVGR